MEQRPLSAMPSHGRPKRRGGHLLMMACCLPMLVLAVVLVATGVLNVSLLAVVACTLMMLFMHAGMGHGGHPPERRQ